MANLYVPMGIPGCGKSYFGKVYFPSIPKVSTDEIRERLTGNENDQTRNEDVFAAFHEEVRSALFLNQDVYADATNLHLFARDKLKACMRGIDQVHYIVFRNGLQALRRNRERERRVPDDVMMYKMLPAYEKMLMQIVQEQCDTMTVIRSF